MRTRRAARPFTAKIAKDAKKNAAPLRVLGVLGGFLLACGASAAAAQATPLIEEPMAVAPGYEAHMAALTIPPAGDGPVTTAAQAGHRHPASTYAYVAKGAVVSRLGDGPEKRYEAGQAWSENPGEAHYIVNASRTEPAQLLVILITKAGTKTLTEPMPMTGHAK